MFSQQVFLTAQHVIDVLPVEFPQNTSQVMTLLAQHKLMQAASMKFVADTLRSSPLYAELKTKFEESPEQMTDEEIICYAVGTATNGDDLEIILANIARTPALTERFTDPVNFCKLYDDLPCVMFHHLSRFYFSTERYRAISEKIDTNFMGLSPQEFFFVFLKMHYYIREHRNKHAEKYVGRLVQYLQKPETLFNFICRAPRFYVYQFACELRFDNRFKHMAADWMLNPKSDMEVVLTALFARDVTKLNVERVRAAISSVKAEYKGFDDAAAYLQSLEASLSFANDETSDAERAAKIQLAAKNRIYINLAGASLENLDLQGAHLEYALVAPQTINLAAKWKEMDRTAMNAAASTRPIWKEIDPVHLVNMRGCDLRNTQLPYCLGLSQVSLRDAKLEGSTIFDFPFLCLHFQLNHSLYECEDAGQIAAYINSQLTRIQRHIEQMLKAKLPLQLAYVAKADKDDPTGYKVTKSKHVAANLMAQYILAAEDEETAQIIYDAAFNHPLFVHTNKATALVNRALLFITPEALKSLNLTKYSDSQDYLFNAMDKRKFLLSQQAHEMRNVMN